MRGWMFNTWTPTSEADEAEATAEIKNAQPQTADKTNNRNNKRRALRKNRSKTANNKSTTANQNSTAVHVSSNTLSDIIKKTFATAKTTGYSVLNQYDPELGGPINNINNNNNSSGSSSSINKSSDNDSVEEFRVQQANIKLISEHKSNNTRNNTFTNYVYSSNNDSDLEDLFPSTSNKNDNTKSRKKIFKHQKKSRRKMTAKTYSLRDEGFAENSMQTQMKNNKLRISLGILVGLVLIAGLGVGLYFLLRNGESSDIPSNNGNTIKLNEILNGDLSVHRFNASWSDGNNLIYKENTNIVEFNTKTKRRTTLLNDERRQYFSYEKSADGQLLLLGRHYKKNFRHSYEAEYDIFNISTGEIHPLTIGGQRSIIMAQWSPVGNALIINFKLNLYYKANALAEEIAITNDKPGDGVLNGVPDWVYEEEVFSSNSGTWFNPNGSQIAYIRIDDSPTNPMSFPFYGEPGDLRYQYPFSRIVAYPKAGSSNPRISLFTVDLERAAQGLSDFRTEIPVPSGLNTETDYIITAVTWLNNDNVLSVWMNRIQNVAYLQTFNGRRRYEVQNIESKTGWVDLFQAPLRNRDGSRIALILPHAQGTYGDYRHLCTISTTTANSQPEFLTKGRHVVLAVLHWDPSSDLIFYTANTEQEANVLHLYAIKASSGQTPKCLTCKLHISGDVEQTYYGTEFNSDHKIVISSLGPGIPMTAIYEWKWTNNQITLTKLVDWETNESLREKLKNKALPTTEIHTIPINGEFTAKVLLQLPPNIDRSGDTKYPMLVDVYGGPDSYSAVDRWLMDWGTYLSSDQNIIYAKIDGRGSGLRGDKLLHSIYLKLGTLEINDQVNVTRQLQEKFNFIDANHTGIWGWSYGGYAAAMALTNDDDNVFRCAASIAPVTDWALYDSIYTERFMSLPKLNAVGYANSRLSTRAEKLRGKKFLLVHGTLDDNVHYQQSMILTKNLERYDILFKQISYPDEDHALAGVRPHLYHSLDRFFGECFERKRMINF